MAEPACDSLSGRLETDVTWRFISCSRVSRLSAPGDATVSGCWAWPWEARRTRQRLRSEVTDRQHRARATARPQAAAPLLRMVTPDSPTTESRRHISTPLGCMTNLPRRTAARVSHAGDTQAEVSLT